MCLHSSISLLKISCGTNGHIDTSVRNWSSFYFYYCIVTSTIYSDVVLFKYSTVTFLLHSVLQKSKTPQHIIKIQKI